MRRLVVLAVLAAIAAGLGGCAPARARYDAVAPGMTAAHVREILGNPRYESADEWVYTQENPRDLAMMTVRFKDGKVVAKRWQAPQDPGQDHRAGEAPN